jgi:predicted  nucleic acid-binding Zn-ribbon protein
VKTYAEQSREVFANEIDNKMKIYNDLEYEVLILKKNTENIEKNIQKVIDIKNKINELIKEKNEINSNLSEKNKLIKSNNFYKEIDILKNTDMKNIELEVLIKNYNDTQNKMNKLKSDLFNTNQQIVELNKIIHGLNDEYKEKRQNNIPKKNKSRNNDKKRNSLESKAEEDIFKKNYDEFILRDKFKKIKNKKEELEYLCNTKLNIIILYLKFLF